MPIVKSSALRREIEGQMKTPRGRVVQRTALAMISDYMSLNAAGCAFYATLALFPAGTMLISIYGMAFDPVTVEPQLAYLRQIMPAATSASTSGQAWTPSPTTIPAPTRSWRRPASDARRRCWRSWWWASSTSC